MADNRTLHRKHPLTDDLKTWRIETSVKITPAEAKDILDFWNRRNRPLKQAKWGPLVPEIQAGRFNYRNGATIGFDTNGDLTDGQNRLEAHRVAKCTAVFPVAFGIEPQARATIDIGAKRTLADIFAIREIPNPGIVSGAVRFLIAYERDGFDFGYRWIKASAQPSAQECLEYNGKHYEALQQAALLTLEKTYRIRWWKSSVTAFMLVKFGEQDLAKAKLFLYQIASGLASPASNKGLDGNTPTFKLREKLIEEQSTLAGERMSFKVGYAINTWNAFCNNKKLGILRINPNHEFPKIEMVQ